MWADVSSRDGRAKMRSCGVFCSIRCHRIRTPADVKFIAELDGQPGAAGTLSLHDGVALFGGASTIPEMRRRGLQAALLEARMRYAFEHGYPLAMMVAEAGSQSQRNAERKGFRIAYTRTKWRL